MRERVAELAGINLTDFLEEGKGTGSGGQAQGGKGKAKVGYESFDAFEYRVNYCQAYFEVVSVTSSSSSSDLKVGEKSTHFVQTRSRKIICRSKGP